MNRTRVSVQISRSLDVTNPADVITASCSCDLGATSIDRAFRVSRIIHANLSEEMELRVAAHLEHVKTGESIKSLVEKFPDPPEEVGI